MSEFQRNFPHIADDLLLTKLVPPRLQASLVQRADLFAQLNRGLDKMVTLVTAPTGFGKTTLVSMWLAAQQIPAAWVGLDEGDNDPVRFWRYVVNAFRRLDANLGKTLLAALRTTQQPPFETLLTGLINELAQLPDPTLLVLDDLHTLTSPIVLETLRFLINHLPENLHLVILSRGEPDLAPGEQGYSLALLRARGELNELQAGDLRFSEAEIDDFLRQTLPFSLSAGAVNRLEQRTEGWPAGVRLVTLAMQGKGTGKAGARDAEQFIETFNGEHRYVLDYLRREVFEKQPEDVREFLLCTCFLARLTGPLCDALTGRTDSAVLLEQLEQGNLFVLPLGNSSPAGQNGGPAWYRYQSLFAEAMRHDALQSLGEPVVLDLQAKASRWYESQGMLEDAIETALSAREFERATHLVEQFLELHNFYEVLTILRWCERMPQEQIQKRPQVSFSYALAILFTGDRYAPATAARIAPLLQAAEDAWQAEGNWPGVGQVLAARGITTWWQGDLAKGFEYTRQALELLPENDLVWRSTALLGAGSENLLNGSLYTARGQLMEAQALSGAAHNIHAMLSAIQIQGDVDFLQGEMDQAGAYFQQVLTEAVGGEEMLDDQSLAWLGLARIAYERNDLAAAEEQAARALELGMRRTNEGVQIPAAIVLAWVAHARGDSSRSAAKMQSLLTRARQPSLVVEIQLQLARMALLQGDLAAARRWYAALSGLEKNLFAAQQEHIRLLSARLCILEGQPEQSLPILKPLRATAQAQGRLRSEVEVLCVEALALQAQGSGSQPIQALTAALAIAHPKGLRRIFLDESEPMAHLLHAAIPGLPKRSLGIYATALLHAFPTRQPAPSTRELPGGAMLIEPLSGQELRVLRLLAAGRSNPEIAGELVVSVNTVKTQVQSIYRKLNVNTREEAREAAREMDLF